MVHFNIAIIGSGVVGLSCAYYLSKFFQDIIVLERNESFGLETSSRNSEVIHSGIYYPENSFKAKLCVIGRHLLYDFCKKHEIRYKKTGKLIVALDENEEKILYQLFEKGRRNGVEGLEIIGSSDIKKIEKNTKGKSAIYSKETGIIDSHGFMKRLYFLAKDKGVIFAFKNQVTEIKQNKNLYKLFTSQGESVFVRNIVNSGGLHAHHIAKCMGIDIDEAGYQIEYYKGDYFYYSKPSLVNSLIYPIPHSDLKGLGIHITIDLGGRMKFGPDVYKVNELEYSVNFEKRDTFFEKASNLIEGLDINALFPDMSGIRPKLKGEGIKDFIISEESKRGLKGVVNLIGIESPGLTSSLAIGEYLVKILKGLDN